LQSMAKSDSAFLYTVLLWARKLIEKIECHRPGRFAIP
jgi:hypothetical protein